MSFSELAEQNAVYARRIMELGRDLAAARAEAARLKEQERNNAGLLEALEAEGVRREAAEQRLAALRSIINQHRELVSEPGASGDAATVVLSLGQALTHTRTEAARLRAMWAKLKEYATSGSSLDPDLPHLMTLLETTIQEGDPIP